VIDDKFLKSVLDSQKALRSYTDAAKAASIAARPMVEALRIYEEDSAVRQMMKEFDRHAAAMRSALGPIEELCRARVAYNDSSFIRAAEEARQAVAAFEARFRLPEMTEIGRLMAEYKASPISEALAIHAAEDARLQRAMENMRTPWLDSQKAMNSIAGIAQLQGIGHALRSMPAFDENLTAALRIDLGDWRDPIAWPKEMFTDLAVRSDFYASLGFNQALTDFPMPAFEQGLDLAGLRPQPPPLVDRYRLPIPLSDEDEEDEGFSRTTMAHNRLLRFETQLRAFIDEQMTLAFGADWPKRRLPNGMYDQWQEKKREEQQTDGKEWPLIAYADFTDYAQLICRRDNWREVFVKFFERPESVHESFQRLYPIRVDTMHARLITQDDELFLYVETLRLEKVIIKKKKLN
jgi:hypothetical protein